MLRYGIDCVTLHDQKTKTDPATNNNQNRAVTSNTSCLCIYILLHANTSGLQQEYKDVVHMAVVCLVISSLHALFNDCKATHDHQASHKAAYSVLFEKAEAGPRWVCTFPLASVNLMILGLRSSCCSSPLELQGFQTYAQHQSLRRLVMQDA